MLIRGWKFLFALSWQLLFCECVFVFIINLRYCDILVFECQNIDFFLFVSCSVSNNNNSLLEKGSPFKRKIHPDEIWLYRNPKTDSYVPTEILWPFVFGVPCSIFIIHFLATKNKVEFLQANLSLSLALGLNGIITNVLKLCVGKEAYSNEKRLETYDIIYFAQGDHDLTSFGDVFPTVR